MKYTKNNLYRKVNTKARWVSHQSGIDFKHLRNKKKETLETVKGSMHGKHQRGLDYTPLFRFLLSKVGCNWDEVHSEAVSRLDKSEPIFWMVAIRESEKQEYVRTGESSYYSGLYVDRNGILQYVNPSLKSSDIGLFCTCCTHTFNGNVYTEKKTD